MTAETFRMTGYVPKDSASVRFSIDGRVLGRVRLVPCIGLLHSAPIFPTDAVLGFGGRLVTEATLSAMMAGEKPKTGT
jgi:hypothetical protein